MKVLVSDPLSSVGIEIFKNMPEIEVDVKTNLSQSELKEIIGAYHIALLMSLSLICSCHLGASTHEAQDNVARDVANQMVDFLLNGSAPNVVNNSALGL